MREYLNSIVCDNIKLIRNDHNFGWVKSVNRGINESDAQYLCVINNDIILTKGWLGEMISVAESAEDIGLVNPEWEKPDNISVQGYADKLKKNRGFFIETDWMRGFCFLIKRVVIDSIGGLDEAYSPGYYDDCDFSVRAIKAGFRCVRAKASYVYHYRNVTHKHAFKKKQWDELMQKNKKLFQQRWGKPLRIIFVFKKNTKDTDQIEEIMTRLARDQHCLYIWAANRSMPKIQHTNVKLTFYPYFLLSLLLLVNIWNNLARNINKRYDIIFTNDDFLIHMLSFFKIDNKISTNLVDFDNCSIAVKIGAEVENKRDERKVNGGNNN